MVKNIIYWDISKVIFTSITTNSPINNFDVIFDIAASATTTTNTTATTKTITTTITTTTTTSIKTTTTITTNNMLIILLILGYINFITTTSINTLSLALQPFEGQGLQQTARLTSTSKPKKVNDHINNTTNSKISICLSFG